MDGIGSRRGGIRAQKGFSFATILSLQILQNEEVYSLTFLIQPFSFDWLKILSTVSLTCSSAPSSSFSFAREQHSWYSLNLKCFSL